MARATSNRTSTTSKVATPDLTKTGDDDATSQQADESTEDTNAEESTDAGQAAADESTDTGADGTTADAGNGDPANDEPVEDPCPECFPAGWPDNAEQSVGCTHGMWLRPWPPTETGT
jgi:hypothetical protein